MRGSGNWTQLRFPYWNLSKIIGLEPWKLQVDSATLLRFPYWSLSQIVGLEPWVRQLDSAQFSLLQLIQNYRFGIVGAAIWLNSIVLT